MKEIAHPEILAEVKRRGISSVVHFLPIGNLVGVLDTSALKCRKILPESDRVRCVYKPNVPKRLDEKWIDYVNLSIERINDEFLPFSRRNRRSDCAWCILGFDPAVLAHRGVFFVQTNNVYPSAVRGEGIHGFKKLFAPTVQGRFRQEVYRTIGHRAAWPTDRQAEVLYPDSVDCSHLRQITVESENVLDTIAGILEGLGSALKADTEVRCEPGMFK